MKTFKNIASSVISVPINNNYCIYAFINWSEEANAYLVNLWLKENTIDNLYMMYKYENLEFESNKKNIKVDVTNYINNEIRVHGFENDIDAYEYQNECFEAGNRYFEDEGYDDYD